jgi:hypothetical protein
VDRLFDSFDLPLGPARSLQLMNPLLPDGDTVLTRIGIAPHGRAWRTIVEAWPAIRAELDAGRTCPLGLVRVRSANPVDLKHDHQVLAYGYTLAGEDLTIRVYDSNEPGRDDAAIRLPVATPTRPTAITTTPAGQPVYAFFPVSYRPPRTPLP